MVLLLDGEADEGGQLRGLRVFGPREQDLALVVARAVMSNGTVRGFIKQY